MSSSPSGHDAIDRLRHVSGVLGSFTCSATGQLLASDMPESYTRPALESTAARLTNLFQSVDEALRECRSVKLAFAENQLLVRRFKDGFLCVLTRADFDRQMLRVTTRMVLRRLVA